MWSGCGHVCREQRIRNQESWQYDHNHKKGLTIPCEGPHADKASFSQYLPSISADENPQGPTRAEARGTLQGSHYLPSIWHNSQSFASHTVAYATGNVLQPERKAEQSCPHV